MILQLLLSRAMRRFEGCAGENERSFDTRGHQKPFDPARAPGFPATRQYLDEPHSRAPRSHLLEDTRMQDCVPTFSKFPSLSIRERKRKLSE